MRYSKGRYSRANRMLKRYHTITADNGREFAVEFERRALLGFPIKSI